VVEAEMTSAAVAALEEFYKAIQHFNQTVVQTEMALIL
jgi:hypothetical protein